MMMGGDIGLISAPGEGTRITVCVNLPDAPAPTEPATDSPVTIDANRHSPLAGLRVLIVDDHPANRIVLDGQIRNLGGTTRLAVDGHAALRLWRESRDEIDVIVTDCSMPVMSGEQLASAIRADEAASSGRVPIIGLTANAQPDAAARALGAGMTACLVKPIGLDALRDALLADAAPHRPDQDKANVQLPPSSETAPFDHALLAAFGDQRGALIDTLRTANAQDIAEARAAFEAGDRVRLGELAHRMKGAAAAVIGATPFIDSCVALQRACDSNDDPASAFDMFMTAATTLERALESAVMHYTA
ncbi:response regulator [Candidatus Burkholderia verschuerenii]|uniref:response regulator n=1 Tax=Candidatus Burkholderia verschuerenii TaxID=242163 RepID=UPI000B1B4C58